MMSYKGYLGVARPDTDARVFRGSVVNIVDTITFQGATYEELEREFQASVDDYLEFCASRGESPDKPFSGRLPLRMKPETHRALAIQAKAHDVSLNTFVSRLLEECLTGRRAEVKNQVIRGGFPRATAQAGQVGAKRPAANQGDPIPPGGAIRGGAKPKPKTKGVGRTIADRSPPKLGEVLTYAQDDNPEAAKRSRVKGEK